MTNPSHREDLFDSSMTLGDHLEELRIRIIYALIGIGVGMIAGFMLAKPAISWLQGPYMAVMPGASLQTLSPSEGFLSYVKIAMVISIVVASPWVFYQLWMFVAAGLYPHEKRYVHLAVPFSAILFIAGVLFFMVVIAPITLNFLVVMNNWLDLETSFTFKYYIAFISQLILVFGVAFQTPSAIFFLNRLGIVSLESLRRARKYVIIGIAVVSAMATPPDVVSQLALAGPLYLLYEFGILISHIAARRRAERENDPRL